MNIIYRCYEVVRILISFVQMIFLSVDPGVRGLSLKFVAPSECILEISDFPVVVEYACRDSGQLVAVIKERTKIGYISIVPEKSFWDGREMSTILESITEGSYLCIVGKKVSRDCGDVVAFAE